MQTTHVLNVIHGGGHSTPLRRSLKRLGALALVSAGLLAGALAPGGAWAQAATAGAGAGANKVASPTPPGHMVAEIQVIPRPLGTADDRYKHVDAAIAVIQGSGLRYEVHALGTVVEGPADKVWALLQAVHQATLEAGAERTLSVIKLSSSAQAGGARVEDLVRKFRP